MYRMAQDTQTVVGTGTCCLVVVSLLSDSLPLLVNLKQRFMTFIHKALSHKSLVLCSVAVVYFMNTTCIWPCTLGILAVYASDIGRVW